MGNAPPRNRPQMAPLLQEERVPIEGYDELVNTKTALANLYKSISVYKNDVIIDKGYYAAATVATLNLYKSKFAETGLLKAAFAIESILTARKGGVCVVTTDKTGTKRFRSTLIVSKQYKLNGDDVQHFFVTVVDAKGSEIDPTSTCFVQCWYIAYNWCYGCDRRWHCSLRLCCCNCVGKVWT